MLNIKVEEKNLEWQRDSQLTAHGTRRHSTTNGIILKATWNFYQYFMADLSVCSEAYWWKIGHWGEEISCVCEYVCVTAFCTYSMLSPSSESIRSHTRTHTHSSLRTSYRGTSVHFVYIPFVHNFKYKMENQNLVRALLVHCIFVHSCCGVHAECPALCDSHTPFFFRAQQIQISRSFYYYETYYILFYFSFVFCFRRH